MSPIYDFDTTLFNISHVLGYSMPSYIPQMAPVATIAASALKGSLVMYKCNAQALPDN
jgi:hypothetical protein